MNYLLFSDVHCDLDRCERLVELSSQADIVLGAGDFGNFRTGLKETIAVLKKISRPTVIVPGNAESFEELTDACSVWPAATVLHGSGIELQGVSFYGIGGGVPVTPFGAWSYDFSEAEAEVLLADMPPGAILISHSPPKGLVDRSSRGQSIGSTAIRAAIEKKGPPLTVCGHIHGSAGQQSGLGEFVVINAGPAGILYSI